MAHDAIAIASLSTPALLPAAWAQAAPGAQSTISPAAEAIQAPFDQEIKGAKDAPGRLRIQKTIASLTQQSKDLVGAASAVGIKKLTLVEP